MDAEKKSFGAALREMLNEKGLKPSDFIDILDTKPKTVYDWLNDKSIPRMKNIKKMADVLDCSVDHLLSYL